MDSKNSYVGSILMFLNMFVLIIAMILLMIVGAYHLLFEEPERLPYKAVVYDRIYLSTKITSLRLLIK